MDFKEQMTTYRERINKAIHRLLPSPETRPHRLHQAMLYSMNAGGKRLRPMLALAACDGMGGSPHDPEPAAVSLECLHTYSLIHDDLPAMDDSDLRRGAPTCHKAYDEATAILAGDALLTFAFELPAREYRLEPALAAALIADLADAAGSQALIGGQMEDILSERSHACSEETLAYIHRNKTAALIRCSLLFGARLAGAGSDGLQHAGELGLHLGLAFQLIDDLLDVSQNSQTLGKPAGLDHQNDTATAIHFFGVEKTREFAREQTRQALQACEILPGDLAFLRELIRWMENRIH